LGSTETIILSIRLKRIDEAVQTRKNVICTVENFSGPIDSWTSELLKKKI